MAINFCSLASGSNGNCQFIGTDKTKLLLDVGMSGKYIREALESISVMPEDINGIVLSHEHSDHIKGVGIVMRRHKIPLYVTEKTWLSMKDKIGKVDEVLVNIISDPESFNIGDIDISSITVSHDAADPRCYVFEHQKAKVCIATDLGVVSEEAIGVFSDSDLLMIESNHDEEMLKVGRYPYYLKRRILSEHGHLSNEVAGYIAQRAVRNGRVKNILLAHLSQDNNVPELAYETVKIALKDEGIKVGEDVSLNLTYRGKVGQFYKVVQSKNQR